MGDPELEAVQRRIDQARRELEELKRSREAEAVENLSPEERRRRWQVITGGAAGAALGWVAARAKDPLTYTIAITAALVAGVLLLPDEPSPPAAAPPPTSGPLVEPVMPAIVAEIHEDDEPVPHEPGPEATSETAPSLEVEPSVTTGVVTDEPDPTLSTSEPEPEPVPAPAPEPEPEPPKLREDDKCLDVDTPRVELGECVRTILGLLD